MSDDMDDGWAGTPDPTGGAGGEGTGPSGQAPVQIAPGVWAGDFVNGKGLLGIRRTTDADGGQGSPGSNPPTPPAPDWGPNGPVDPYDVYRWMQRLGDQGIAYKFDKNGKLYVYETPDWSEWDPKHPEIPPPWKTVDTDEYVPGQNSGQPADWRSYAPPTPVHQDLGRPYEQELNAIRQSDRYLFRDPASAALGRFMQDSHVPTVMVPDKEDRFEPGQGSRGVIYWNPLAALQTPGSTPWLNGLNSIPGSRPVQSPALVLDHERNHARDWVTDPIGYLIDRFTPTGDDYDNWEEKRTIDNVETPAAQRLGEPTRTDHRGDLVFVPKPTSHTPIQRQMRTK